MARVQKPASVRPPERREKKDFKQIPKTQKPPRPQKKAGNIASQGSIEERLEYYKRKYGENFNLAGTESIKPEKKEGFFNKIKKALGRKRDKE